MDAIANAAVAAPDAPRDIGRPMPFYICRNCWHTFSVTLDRAADEDRPNGSNAVGPS
jgi:hypothetical protein